MFQSTLRTWFVALVSIGLLLAASAMAEIPQYISYQGKITDASGTPVPDGSYTMRFRIYNDATGGSLLWDSGSQTVTTTQGVANVLLGESPQPALTLSFAADYWLLVTFQGTDQSPRVRLTSAGYSYMASGLVPGTVVDGEVTAGAYPGSVVGVNQATSGANYGGYFRSLSTSGTGVFGFGGASTGTNCGVQGVTNSPDGRAVYGHAGSSTGDAYGVFGRSDSSSGYGVYGYAWASTGTNCGVFGKTNSSDGFGVVGLQPGYSLGDIGAQPEAGGLFGGTIGVMGLHKTGGGYGVFGWAKNTSGIGNGVFGLADSNQGVAVNGWATRASGQTWGGFFRSDADSGVGVGGQASSPTGVTYGGYFQSSSPTGYGVYGVAGGTTGVSYGVYGRTDSPSGYAGYFQGNARVTGNLTVDGSLLGSGIGDITAVNAGTGLVGGAMSGDAMLEVKVPLHLSASHLEPIIKGRNTNTTQLTVGVYGESASTEGRGVEGYAAASTGNAYGVYGESNSSFGAGVHGYASSTAPTATASGVRGETRSAYGAGVYGLATASTGNAYGGEFWSSSSEGNGVHGVATASTGSARGGDFSSSASEGTGVAGEASASSGATHGGYFRSSSSEGTGVYGSVTPSVNADRYGVHGRCFPSENWGIGVRGEGGYRGVHGVSTHTSGSYATYGVYGEASGAAVNWGVYASGDMGCSGTKSAVVRTEEGPKAVYCMESPEVWFEDFGSGEIQNGQAVVRLAGDFLQTVVIGEEHPFKVFVTPKARLGDWWIEDGTRDFRLVAPDAPNGARFDYRVVAKRRGYESVRLEARPDAYSDHFLYPSLSEVPAAHQAEWRKADGSRNERAPERGGAR